MLVPGREWWQDAKGGVFGATGNDVYLDVFGVCETPFIGSCGRMPNELKVYGGMPSIFMGSSGAPRGALVCGGTAKTVVRTAKRQQRIILGARRHLSA